MSAICGIIEPNGLVSESVLTGMRDVMTHRAPHDAGFYLSGDRKVGLAHHRLDTIDLSSAGHQPMSNEDGTIWVTHEGEISNFLDLRRSLETKQHRFKSGCDAEVILHLYEELGDEFPSKLDGQFAIALWDGNKNVLYLTRDRIGKKPLYYSWDGKRFLFASELKAVAEHPDISKEIDPLSLDDYLTFQYVPCPNTIFKRIKKLPPAHILRFKDCQISSLPYWRLAPEKNAHWREDIYYEESIRDLLQDSVKKCLQSDVPVGVLLSGGLASSTIVAILNTLANGTVKTFSVGFGAKEHKDLSYAEMVADRLGTDHHTIVIHRQPATDLIPKIAGQLDEPLVNLKAVPFCLMTDFVRQHVPVCLSGEGQQELFGGHPGYHVALHRKRLVDSLAIGNEVLKEDLSRSLFPSLESYVDLVSAFPAKERNNLLHPDLKAEIARRREISYPHIRTHYASSRGLDFLTRLQYLNVQTYLPDNLLVTIDRAGMLASVELRVPFLDYELIQAAFLLPHHLKISGGIQSYILKRIMERLLPPQVLWRSNHGVSFLLSRLFSSDLEDYARELLLRPGRGYFRKAYIHGLFRDNWMDNPRTFSKLLTLVMFEEWRRVYKA